jgi:hypothetical protein
MKAMTSSNIEAVFRRTGIWPHKNIAMINKMDQSEGFIEKVWKFKSMRF